MKKGALPKGWFRWRRTRYQALAAQGLASHLAWEVAAAEARGRHRISKIVGKVAAEAAELTWTEIGGTLRFALVGDNSSLTDKQIAAIRELNCGLKEAA